MALLHGSVAGPGRASSRRISRLRTVMAHITSRGAGGHFQGIHRHELRPVNVFHGAAVPPPDCVGCGGAAATEAPRSTVTPTRRRGGLQKCDRAGDLAGSPALSTRNMLPGADQSPC